MTQQFVRQVQLAATWPATSLCNVLFGCQPRRPTIYFRGVEFTLFSSVYAMHKTMQWLRCFVKCIELVGLIVAEIVDHVEIRREGMSNRGASLP